MDLQYEYLHIKKSELWISCPPTPPPIFWNHVKNWRKNKKIICEIVVLCIHICTTLPHLKLVGDPIGSISSWLKMAYSFSKWWEITTDSTLYWTWFLTWLKRCLYKKYRRERQNLDYIDLWFVFQLDVLHKWLQRNLWEKCMRFCD